MLPTSVMRRQFTILGLGWFVLGAACSNNMSGALVAIEEVSPGKNCESGGTRVRAGADDNGDGKLDDSEVDDTTYVCNGDSGSGEPGEPGATGDTGPKGRNASKGDPGDTGPSGPSGDTGAKGQKGDAGPTGPEGATGPSALILTSTEPSGANCAFGGTKVEVGLDADRDGTLDTSEVDGDQTRYICNGAPGGAGVAGFRLVSKYVAPGGPIAEIVSPSPDGKTLVYTSSSTGTIGFADITNPAAPTLLGTTNLASITGGDGEPTSVAFSPDGAHVVAVVKDTANPIDNADPGALVVIDAATRAVAGQVALGVGPDSVALTPDGTKAVVAIEDEEDEGGNNAAQSRPGSVQVITINYADPSASTVETIALTPTLGNMPTDPQPEYVDITKDGKTAVVSLQENNVFAVIDLETNEVTRYLDAGNSVHARADLLNDRKWNFTQPYEAQAQPDGTCLLPDQKHFISANEGDTSNTAFGVYAGGRGFSIYHLEEGRVADSGDALEWAAFRSGAYPDARSANRGVEPEGCGTGTFGGKPYAFITGERDASLFAIDVANPKSPVIRQVLGAPNRPESVGIIESRGLIVVGGEGDGAAKGGGIWIYEAVHDPSDVGHGSHVYDARSPGGSFGALSALAYQPSTDLWLALPDNAYLEGRIWSFAVDHASKRVDLVDELMLRDTTGEILTDIDPEGLVVNPEGGFIVATEGTNANGGGGATCAGSKNSNRILFFTALGELDPIYGNNGVIDLPCGADTNAFDWNTMGSNGFEGITVVDSQPNASGGLKVYIAFQRPLAGAEAAARKTRIGEYDVDLGVWNFFYYVLDADVGGASGNTFLSELIHVGGDTFAVIERDQGYSSSALNKTVRTFKLSSGTANDPNDPVEKTTAIDLLADSFRFDQEKIEGLAIGGGSLFVVNDNDGGTAQNFFVRFSPNLLGTSSGGAGPEVIPSIVINELASTGFPNDFVELKNLGSTPVNVSGFTLTDGGGGVHTLPNGTAIAAGGLLLIDALAFGLGSNDSVTLKTALGTVIDSYAYTTHVSSASRCGTSGLIFWPTTGTSGSAAGTPGAENNCTGPAVAGQRDVVVNEVKSNPGTDFVELFNSGAASVDLAHWKLLDNDTSHTPYVLPPGTTIAAGGFLVVEGEGSPGSLVLPFGIGSGDSVTLFSPYDQVVSELAWGSGHATTANRCPDGGATIVNPLPETKGAANACP